MTAQYLSPVVATAPDPTTAPGFLARFWLRKADAVGPGLRISGRPYIENNGSIVIGSAFRFSSYPAQSHLATIGDGEIMIGDRVTISHGAAIAAMKQVTIGDDTQIGPYVVIMDGDFHSVEDRNAPGEISPVAIGRGVVIGARVTILRGSAIGDGARIESGCVVSGDVPAGAVFAGVPGRPVVHAASGEDMDLAELVMNVLGLDALPGPDDGPEQIPQWDSLGSLRLLLAVEDAYGTSLSESDMTTARSVAALSRAVAAARAARDGGAHA